jgi:thiol-disulfide isomerase/thioredoxin
MKIKQHWISAGLLALAAVSTSMAEPFGEIKFEDACATATNQNKIVLIDFFTTWCGPCKLLDQRTWKDPEVIKLLESKTVSLKLDAEKQTDLAGRYRIDAYPTVVLLRPNGTEIDRLVGFREPGQFISDFNSALNGKDSVTRAREAVKTAGNDEPMARMALGRSLVEKQKYGEALGEYTWCFDHGLEKNPAFVGVRSSFLLSDIMALSLKYPPARETLEKWRDEREAAVISGVSDGTTVRDVVRLNEVLNQRERNLTLFNRLPPKSPSRFILLENVLDQLLSAKRYEEVLRDADPGSIFSREVKRVNEMSATLGKSATTKDRVERVLRERTVSTGSHYFEALAGVHNDDEAKTLADQILKFDSTETTKDKLVQGADRAGDADLVKYIRSK